MCTEENSVDWLQIPVHQVNSHDWPDPGGSHSQGPHRPAFFDWLSLRAFSFFWPCSCTSCQPPLVQSPFSPCLRLISTVLSHCWIPSECLTFTLLAVDVTWYLDNPRLSGHVLSGAIPLFFVAYIEKTLKNPPCPVFFLINFPCFSYAVLLLPFPWSRYQDTRSNVGAILYPTCFYIS